MPTLRKQERSQIKNLALCLKEIEKEEPSEPKVCIRNDIKKIRAETNEIETKKTIENTSETRRWSLVDKSLVRLTKRKRERAEGN